MRRYRPDWISLLEGRQHLVVTGAAPYDAEVDITLAIRDRKILLSAPKNKITITTFAGEIVHPLNPAVLTLKRRGEWRLSYPEDLSPGDLDFENSGSKKPWLYPGFHAHISSGLRLRFDDFVRVFRLDDVDDLAGPAVQARQPADQNATRGQKSALADIDQENSLPKKPSSYGEDYLAHIVRLDLSEEEVENVLRRCAADSRKEPFAQSPKPRTEKASAPQIKRAIAVLTAALRINPKLFRKDAMQLVKNEKLPLGPTQFDNAWHAARLRAGLSANARGGRPPKSVIP
jgi:hypothetical protein